MKQQNFNLILALIFSVANNLAMELIQQSSPLDIAPQVQTMTKNEQSKLNKYFVKKCFYCDKEHLYCDFKACGQEYCCNERRCFGCCLRDIFFEKEICCDRESYLNRRTHCCETNGCCYEFITDETLWGTPNEILES